MFKWLFGKKGQREISALVLDQAQRLSKPAVQLVKAQTATRSHLGGLCTLTPRPAAPQRNGVALPLVAQIDLQDLQQKLSTDWLPKSGTLLFYYDWIKQDTWGFDPKDMGKWSVQFIEERAPENNFESNNPSKDFIAPKSVDLRVIHTLPSHERSDVSALNFNDQDFDDWSELSDQVYQKLPQHQLLGFPANVQSDSMELECQLVSNGLYCGDSSGYNDPRAIELGRGASDWRLLLQIDSDDDLDVMFGDLGKIYFWIRQQDAEARKFEKAMFVLQCY